MFLSRRSERILFVLVFLWPGLVHSQDPQRIPLYLKNLEIRVEVAKTPEEREKGLMGRKHLGPDDGMLFIFETEDYHGFWMKNTLIPLNIAFIDKGGRIVSIAEMKPLTLDSHDPPKPILYALEMNKGWFSKHGIKAGDVVGFPNKFLFRKFFGDGL
jgi:uncharacterized membrane protein (UPF0127 family)